MNYDESLENDRELLEGYKPERTEPEQLIYVVVHSTHKNSSLKELTISFSSYDKEESENALELDTLTAALAKDKEIKSFSLCEIPESKLDKRRINNCTKYLNVLITNKTC